MNGDLSDQPAAPALSAAADTGELAAALHRHVSVLAAAPRNRRGNPAQLSAARAHVTDQLHRKDSSPLARGWAGAAGRAGLPAVLYPDNRYTGPGYRVERLVDFIGANLDRSDHAPFWNLRRR